MNEHKSSAYGQPLPWYWVRFADKSAIIKYLQQPHMVDANFDEVWKRGYRQFFNMTPASRLRVVQHLLDVGSIPKFVQPQSRPPITASLSEAEDTNVVFWVSKQLYGKPNGGKRMLPSIYTRLTHTWLRSTGKFQPIHNMNTPHIRNCIALLEESHRNASERSLTILGKMFAHYQNVPALNQSFKASAGLVEGVRVDQMYPIYNALKSELNQRPETMDFDMSGIDDNLAEWMDFK